MKTEGLNSVMSTKINGDNIRRSHLSKTFVAKNIWNKITRAAIYSGLIISATQRGMASANANIFDRSNQLGTNELGTNGSDATRSIHNQTRIQNQTKICTSSHFNSTEMGLSPIGEMVFSMFRGLHVYLQSETSCRYGVDGPISSEEIIARPLTKLLNDSELKAALSSLIRDASEPTLTSVQQKFADTLQAPSNFVYLAVAVSIITSTCATTLIVLAHIYQKLMGGHRSIVTQVLSDVAKGAVSGVDDEPTAGQVNRLAKNASAGATSGVITQLREDGNIEENNVNTQSTAASNQEAYSAITQHSVASDTEENDQLIDSMYKDKISPLIKLFVENATSGAITRLTEQSNQEKIAALTNHVVAGATDVIIARLSNLNTVVNREALSEVCQDVAEGVVAQLLDSLSDTDNLARLSNIAGATSSALVEGALHTANAEISPLLARFNANSVTTETIKNVIGVVIGSGTEAILSSIATQSRQDGAIPEIINNMASNEALLNPIHELMTTLGTAMSTAGAANIGKAMAEHGTERLATILSTTGAETLAAGLLNGSFNLISQHMNKLISSIQLVINDPNSLELLPNEQELLNEFLASMRKLSTSFAQADSLIRNVSNLSSAANAVIGLSGDPSQINTLRQASDEIREGLATLLTFIAVHSDSFSRIITSLPDLLDRGSEFVHTPITSALKTTRREVTSAIKHMIGGFSTYLSASHADTTGTVETEDDESFHDAVQEQLNDNLGPELNPNAPPVVPDSIESTEISGVLNDMDQLANAMFRLSALNFDATLDMNELEPFRQVIASLISHITERQNDLRDDAAALLNDFIILCTNISEPFSRLDDLASNSIPPDQARLEFENIRESLLHFASFLVAHGDSIPFLNALNPAADNNRSVAIITRQTIFHLLSNATEFMNSLDASSFQENDTIDTEEGDSGSDSGSLSLPSLMEQLD